LTENEEKIIIEYLKKDSKYIEKILALSDANIITRYLKLLI